MVEGARWKVGGRKQKVGEDARATTTGNAHLKLIYESAIFLLLLFVMVYIPTLPEMDKQDELFNEAYKPIHVPANFSENDSLQDQLLFALAEIGKGSVAEIVEKLAVLKGKADELQVCDAILHDLYNRGLIKGSEQEDVLVYNLSKETVPHGGKINPRLL